MELIFAVPASIKILAAFAAILVLYQLGTPLGIAICCCGALLTLWSGAGLDGIRFQIDSFLKPDNYLLLIAILLLLFFTEALSVTGRMKRTITALKEYLASKKILMA